ncbi:MAG: carboxylate-amine ligase, partial [Jatrophihabitans sp.]|uniref:carboxylate-amine ligase n=1 Tax=Jatrophihabitans sp. TaxID=1932789 RepID=UPI003F7E29F8
MTAPIGSTLGVEEEYHLVDPVTLALQHRPDLLGEGEPPGLRAEMLTSQLEAVTPVCTTLDETREAIIAARRTAAKAAADQGATILATSTHPFAPLSDIEVMPRPRYERLVERFGSIVRQFNLTGLHVHVGVPDLGAAVAIMSRARAYLPTLAALTGSSPLHEGGDTGYGSFRLAWLDLWPQGGPPPALRDAQHYVDTVAQLAAVGLIDDASTLLWELRPSLRWPTLEFRIADVCPEVDDAVLLAGLARSLVRTMWAQVEAGRPARDVPDAVLRAARWRAARYGIGERLWSPTRSVLLPARAVLDDLLAELRDDLDEHGEY